MTQLSGFWTTTGTASGHQQASYTQAHWSTAAEILAACSGFEGVAPGYLNELACSDGGADTVDVATGGAVVDGKWYKNDAEINQSLNRPAGGYSRIDRLVIRCTWANFEAVLTVIEGTASTGTPVAPSITQTTGTTYDILLCQALIDDAGAVTITDERVWALVDVDDSTITNVNGTIGVPNSGIDTDQIAADAVTTAKIPNRTRSFLVTPPEVSIGGTLVIRQDQAGYRSADGNATLGFGEFYVPTDFASGMTVQAVVQSTATANMYVKNNAYYGASGQAYNTHSNTVGPAAVAVTNAQIALTQSNSLSSVAAGDVVTLEWERDAGNVSDTIGGIVYFKGWLVSYTADS